jgi:hypothetical protein
MKTTLGEDKTGACAVCHNAFRKTRFDQKFCSLVCRTQAKKFYRSSKWFDRPDREEQNRHRNERYYAGRENILARQRAWRAENPEKARAKDRTKYERNKAKHIARTSAYRKAHPGIRQQEYRNARNKQPRANPLMAARHRSLKKSFSFDLTREWAEQNWTGTCAVTGLPFEFGTSRAYPFAPSIDRKDSALGYTKDNCRFVLFAVNSFKGVGTDEQMLKIATALVDHQALLARL